MNTMNSIERVSSGNGYTCEKCEKNFDSIVSRKLHSLDCTVVPIIPGLKKDVVCPVVNCRSAFYTHERLTLHVREDHDSVCSQSNHDYGLREVYFNQQSDFTDWFTNICQKYEYNFVKSECPLPNTQVFTCGDGETNKKKQFCPAFVKLKSEDNGRFTCTFSFIHAFHGFCCIPIIEVPKGNFCFVIKNKKQLPNYDSRKTPEAKTSEKPEGLDTDVVFLSKTIASSPSFTSPIGITDEAELSLKPGVRVENLWDMPDVVSNALPHVTVTPPSVQNGTEDHANHSEKLAIAPCFLKFSKNLLPPPLLCTNHPTTLIPLTLDAPSFSARHGNDNTEQNLIKRSNDQCHPISYLATDDSKKASYLGSSLPCVSNTTQILPAADNHEKKISSVIQCQADRAYEEKRASLNNALNSMNAHDTDVANKLFNNRTVAGFGTDTTPKVNAVNGTGERLTFKLSLKPSGQSVFETYMERKKAKQKKFGHERALEQKVEMEKTIENLVASVKAAALNAVEKKRSVKNKAIKDKAVKERTAKEKAAKERAAEKKIAKHRTAKEEITKDDGFGESSVDELMEEGRSSSQTVSSPNFNNSGQVRGTGVQARYLLRNLPNYVPATGYSGRKRKASPDETEKLGQQNKPNLRGRVGRLSVLPSRKVSLNGMDISKLPEPIQKASIDMRDLKNSETFSSLLPIDISSENYSLKYQSMRNFHRIKEAGVLLEMFTDSDLPYDLETATLLRETEANMDRIVRKLSSRHSETLKQRHIYNVESHIAEKNLQP